MAKPKVVIADTDSSYIIPLQLRFFEEFYEQVDVEIITEKEYFENVFSAPQKADILIVSEELFDLTLQKHNIANIFLMTEQLLEEKTAQLNVSRIFKYTSIKEIFNEITCKCAGVFKLNTVNKKGTQLVVVYSAAGGVGKTTISLGICSCLTRNYKKVLYINAADINSFQHLLTNPSPISANDVYADLSNANDTIYDKIKHVLRTEQFTYLPPFKASLLSLGISGSIYRTLALSTKKTNEFDYIIVDADSTFDEEKALLISKADKVVTVTTQKYSAVYATNALVANISGSDNEKYIFVCNDYKKDEENALISSNCTPRFTVDEYIEHINNCDSLDVSAFEQSSGIQKVAFLIL